mmetsp:Transcript_28492/g.72607  ORF Transcript_28492/g.72607 Transcript_28492/m.72607 type:complete len:214 (+) Transcript_28492:1083-1724(+)
MGWMEKGFVEKGKLRRGSGRVGCEHCHLHTVLLPPFHQRRPHKVLWLTVPIFNKYSFVPFQYCLLFYQCEMRVPSRPHHIPLPLCHNYTLLSHLLRARFFQASVRHLHNKSRSCLHAGQVVAHVGFHTVRIRVLFQKGDESKHVGQPRFEYDVRPNAQKFLCPDLGLASIHVGHLFVYSLRRTQYGGELLSGRHAEKHRAQSCVCFDKGYDLV